jgi:hypothetical protein
MSIFMAPPSFAHALYRATVALALQISAAQQKEETDMPKTQRSKQRWLILVAALLVLMLPGVASAQSDCAKILCAEGYEPVTDARGCDRACRPVEPPADCVSACMNTGFTGSDLGGCVSLCEALSLNPESRGHLAQLDKSCLGVASLADLK